MEVLIALQIGSPQFIFFYPDCGDWDIQNFGNVCADQIIQKRSGTVFVPGIAAPGIGRSQTVQVQNQNR